MGPFIETWAHEAIHTCRSKQFLEQLVSVLSPLSISAFAMMDPYANATIPYNHTLSSRFNTASFSTVAELSTLLS